MSVGDLGRRVAERRRELGLSTEEVAARTGMSPTYITMVESNPSPHLSRAALWRLAAGLETSVDAISGSGMDVPPGRSDPAGRPDLETLTVEECRSLVAPGGVGRLVYSEGRRPVAVPVNFGVLDGDVVFRTGPTAAALGIAPDEDVSFEVDHLDDALSEGWSVLLTGRVRVVVDPSEIEQARSLGIAPWAGGDRQTFVRLVTRQITGRRIRGEAGHG
jgi:nitroimidazol reductase NimA-like FMN-containing flavoprotein (pyridoxamine 5'-phosphate oxidase superfamily)